MTNIQINFENCYGIKKLAYTFDFSSKRVYSIYAPNGTMKTSFAKTCRDYSSNSNSTDIIFPDRITLREIKNNLNDNIEASNVFVIEP